MKTFIIFLVFLISTITMCRGQNQIDDDDEHLSHQMDQLKLSEEKKLLQQLNQVKRKLKHMELKFENLIEQLQQSLDELSNNFHASSQAEKSDLMEVLHKVLGNQEVMLNKLDNDQCNATLEEFVGDNVLLNTFKNVVSALSSNMTKCDHNSVTENPLFDSYTTPYLFKDLCLNCSKGHGCSLKDGLDSLDPIPHVLCDKESHGSGWIVIQRRLNGNDEFYLDWQDYKSLIWVRNDFWLGLDAIHALTTALAPVELLVELVEQGTGEIRYAKYNEFAIGNEDELYQLKTLGDYEGNAGDALTCHKGYNFSTKDRDNDGVDSANIAVERHGAWWFGNCSQSHLNGRSYDESADDAIFSGIYWGDLFGFKNSIYATEMLIRPRNYTSSK